MPRDASPETIETLHRLAGDAGPPDAEALAPYLAEPRGRWHGQAATLLRPATTEAVARIVAFCRAEGVAIVPYAGGTGLVGGQIMEAGPPPVLLSLERMTRIRALDADDAVAVAEAGVVLADLKAAAEAAGRMFPLTMASEGSCRIGGVLATNAGGAQVLRYGNARDLCLGIEAVLPDGSVHHGLRRVRKDNLGYDLRHLLIGAEGTLGIITAASLRLFPLPGERMTAMLAVPSPAAAVDLFHRLAGGLGPGLSAAELIARRGIDFVQGVHPDAADPLPGRPGWRLLVEATGPAGGGLAARAEAVLAEALEAGAATDGVVAQSEAQRAHMWWLRETIPEANRRVGAVSSHDISVPLSRMPRFVEDGVAAVAAIDPGLRINCFGHLGDGNLHYNVFPAEGRSRADYESLRPAIKAAIHDLVHAAGGSVAAEHGVGRLKTADMARYGDPAGLAAMRAIKAALDPAGIMNPGAVIPGDGDAASG
jgi:FAD/FMN-containing dehydrogenase